MKTNYKIFIYFMSALSVLTAYSGVCRAQKLSQIEYILSWKPVMVVESHHWLEGLSLEKKKKGKNKSYSIGEYLKPGQCLRLRSNQGASPEVREIVLQNKASSQQVVFLYPVHAKVPSFVAMASPNGRVKCVVDFKEGYVSSSLFLQKSGRIAKFPASGQSHAFGKSPEGNVVILPSKGKKMSSWLRVGMRDKTFKTLLRKTRLPDENIAAHSYFPTTFLLPPGGARLRLPEGRYRLTLGSGLQSCFRDVTVKSAEAVQVASCQWEDEERYKVISHLSEDVLSSARFLKWLKTSAYLFPFSMKSLREQKCCYNYNVKFHSHAKEEPIQFFISYPKTPKFQVQEFTQIWDSLGLYAPRPWYRGDSFYKEAIQGFERFIRFLSVSADEDIEHGYNIFMGLNTFYFNALSSDFKVPSFNNGGAIVLESPQYRENSHLLSVNRNNVFEIKINHFPWWVPEVLTTYVNGEVFLKTKLKSDKKSYSIKIAKRSDFKVAFSVTGRKVLPEVIYGVEGLLPFSGTEIFCVDIDENGRCDL